MILVVFVVRNSFFFSLDYNMLKDVNRVVESAQRRRGKMCGYSYFRLPFPLKTRRSDAASLRTKILFLSSGMSKRCSNRSSYNNRKRFISWTIEWRFHSTDVVLLDHGKTASITCLTILGIKFSCYVYGRQGTKL